MAEGHVICVGACGVYNPPNPIISTTTKTATTSIQTTTIKTTSTTLPVPTWIYGEWSDCSKSCGFSHKFRTNQFVNGNKTEIVPEFSICNVDDCGHYSKYICLLILKKEY